MAEAGIDDILIATNILGAARSGRLASLQKRLPLKVCADNQISLREYSKAAEAANRPLDVLIECDTGQKRAGVEDPKEAANFLCTEDIFFDYIQVNNCTRCAELADDRRL